MSTFIYIPKNYSIADEPGLTDTLKSPLTYRSAQLFRSVTTSTSGYLCACGEGLNVLDGGEGSSVKSKLNAFVSSARSNTASLNGRVIHFAPCDRYEFPGLQNSDWTPDVFNDEVTYHNNTSGTGQFIGRSIVRRSRTVSIQPISFNAPVERMQELRLLATKMEQAPFYVKVCAPYADYVVYGWTEKAPQISYTSDYGQVTFSFSMRTTA